MSDIFSLQFFLRQNVITVETYRRRHVRQPIVSIVSVQISYNY